MTSTYQKKVKLSVHGRRVKWAPVWAVVRRFGAGKKKHPSEMTKIRRNWKTNKLKVKPRRQRKQQLG